MKKVFLGFFINFVFLVVVEAQDYEKFRVGFGSGFTLANLDESVADGGIIFTLEPGYHIGDDVVVGLRLEFADTQLDILYGGNPIGSYTVNGQYYFGEKKFRPLVGMGLGLFTVPSYGSSNESKKFGFYPRVGFDLGHFFLAMEYNLIQPSENIYLDEITNNYFGFRVGYFAGGGKKRAKEVVQ